MSTSNGVRGTKGRDASRKSGKTASVEEADAQADALEDPVEEKVLPEEREQWFRSPGFSRMKTAWSGEEAKQMQRVQGAIDRKVYETFKDALSLMNDLYDVVREPDVVEGTGEVKKDLHGFTAWKKHPVLGTYYEDWTRLTTRQREHFLYRITTSLFEWEQRSADLWTEAMFAKAMFTEKFSIEYDAPMTGTIDDRNAVGNVKAAEDRYFALMNAAVSRKAEALVRTLTNLQLRLRDTLGQ